MKMRMKRVSTFLLALVFVLTILPVSAMAKEPAQDRVAQIVSQMSLDEKISQMIIPAIRTWNGEQENVTSLLDAEELAAALRNHQYGGVILFGANINNVKQTAKLVSELQKNNAQIDASTNIPYLMPLDMEGGIVNRLTMGTRMTGNMAVAATTDNAENNALETGRIIGEEMAALGFNADFAPVVDVNCNPANPVIGTRSFSDDPDLVAKLGPIFQSGLATSNVIASYKHFPGHGDTSTDSHSEETVVDKKRSELEEMEFVPFRKAIANGADMIMTAHIIYPKIESARTLPGGRTGYYPATMSHKMMTEILRGDMGFQGVIVTDALEMGAIVNTGLVEGEAGSAEYSANIAEQVINAGVDILLLPTDLNGNDPAIVGRDKVQWYDDYIDLLEEKVGEEKISEERINESVTRILKLKEKYGILDMDTSGADIDERVENAKRIVGSSAHHATEMELARQAITLVRNENDTLPFNGSEQKAYVFVGRTPTETNMMHYAVDHLIKLGLIPENAYVKDLYNGTTSGSKKSPVKITIDFYNDTTNKEYYSNKPALQVAVKEADAVIAISYCGGAAVLADTNTQYKGLMAMRKDVQEGGGRFVVLSDNLPYDSARYQEADAIVLAYMGSGMGTDPTEREGGNANAYNANVLAAFATIFGGQCPSGKLPVQVPVITVDAEGNAVFNDEILYPRGFGLTYPVDISNYAAALSATSFEYTGKEIKPKVTVANLTAADYFVSYSNNIKIGTAKVTITGNRARNYKGSIVKTFRITKKSNAVKAKISKRVLKAKSLKKKAKVYKITSLIKAVSAKGKVSYQIKAADKRSKKVLKIGKNKVTVRKRTKAGTYKLLVTVKDAGNGVYKAAKKTFTVKIKVK